MCLHVTLMCSETYLGGTLELSFWCVLENYLCQEHLIHHFQALSSHVLHEEMGLFCALGIE